MNDKCNSLTADRHKVWIEDQTSQSIALSQRLPEKVLTLFSFKKAERIEEAAEVFLASRV